MVLFDLLKVSDDGKRLYINFHINNAAYFKDLTLDSITILTADKVSETDPLTPTAEYIYKKIYADGLREDSIVLTPVAMNELFKGCDFTKDLFFVYVTVKGTPDACTPCRLDEEITLGVTFDENMLYQRIMQYTRQLANNCDIPQEFIDIILLWNGFKAAIETEHYVVAIDFWKKLFHNRNSSMSVVKECGCHG